MDVGDAGQVQAFVDRAVAEFGRLDVMFANAGIAHSAPFLEHPEAQWHRVLRVNLTGVFLCCQIAARQMVVQGGGGRIITTASINGFRGVENLVGYNAAKAGVIELTKTMAVELAQHGITVNAIAPAQIDTRLTRGLPDDAQGSGAWRAFRWAASARSTRWRRPRCSWPPTTPATSPATPSRWTAATSRAASGRARGAPDDHALLD